MTSEEDIKNVIRPLLDFYGALNTSELKERILEVIELDLDDLQLSETREGEVKIEQIIRNTVSHQPGKGTKIYPQGFMIDKSTKPAMFYAVEGYGSKIHRISDDEIQRRKGRKYRERNNKFKIGDWDELEKDIKELGEAGEEFVLDYERRRVKLFFPDAVNRVQHSSKILGDGYGYDITSTNEKGEMIFIEVKTTNVGKDTPFYLTANEKEFIDQNDTHYYVYRVYDFDMKTQKGSIEIIPMEILKKKYSYDPLLYKVRKRE